MTKERFDELLPFYVNGTLAEADRDWVDAYLREHPKSSAELKWYASLQDKLHQDVPAVSSEVGLERVMQRIRAERSTPARKAHTPGLGERVHGWLSALLPQPVLRPILAGALVVVVAQAVVIANLATERDESTQIRAVRPTVVDKGPYLKVNFRADAREADIRLLLVGVNGSLAGGPSQLGDWYVRIPEAQVGAVAAKLKGSAIVESVAQVDALPARQ
jgi:hypothetical protein